MSQAASPTTRAGKHGAGFSQGGTSATLAEQELMLKPLPILDFSIPMQ